MSFKVNEKKHEPGKQPKKRYHAPHLTKYGDIVEQTMRGHSGPDKNRKTH